MRLAQVFVVAAALPISSSLKAAVWDVDPVALLSDDIDAASRAEDARARLAAVRAADEKRDHRFKTVGGPKPVPPLTEPDGSTPIVLEVSAFQDGERCALTLFRALAKASHPARVSFHLLQARLNQTTDCLAEFKEKHLPTLCQEGAALASAEGVSGGACQQRVLGRSHSWLLDPHDGEGPAHQRGIATSLLEYNREDAMCLSSDSHMDFERGWDTTMISDWASTRNEFAVLSAYPAQVGSRPHSPNGEYIDLCGYYLEEGIPRGRTGGNMFPTPGVAPYLTVNWAAGLSFHRCHAEKNVPVDWHLRWIFTGEEIDRALRLFTSGYDIYLPTNIAVTHNYTHASQAFFSYSPKDMSELRQKSRDRLARIFADGWVPERAENGRHAAGAGGLQQGAANFNFGAGKQRSVEDFVRWGRVNLGGSWPQWMRDNGVTEMQEEESHQYCKTLQRMPVQDEVSLVASVSSKSDGFAADNNGNVKFYGDGEELDVTKLL